MIDSLDAILCPVDQSIEEDMEDVNYDSPTSKEAFSLGNEGKQSIQIAKIESLNVNVKMNSASSMKEVLMQWVTSSSIVPLISSKPFQIHFVLTSRRKGDEIANILKPSSKNEVIQDSRQFFNLRSLSHSPIFRAY
jgi:hypothetical protein